MPLREDEIAEVRAIVLEEIGKIATGRKVMKPAPVVKSKPVSKELKRKL